jgi:hypothetical protein
MSDAAAREWRALVISFAVVTLLFVVSVVAWAVRDLTHDEPTRLELAVRCLTIEKGFAVLTPAGDPLADSAGGGALKTTIEGNDVTIVLASTPEQAIEIERDYRALGTDLEGRLERRDRTVFLWKNVSSPTQRQHAYDCQY